MATRRLRIAIDVDGVLYHWDKTARYMLRTIRGLDYLIYPSTDWDYIKNNVPAADWAWLWNEGVKLGLFRFGHVMEGAINAVRRLGTDDILIVTHRPQSAVQDTLDWLSYMRFEPAEVHILSDGQPKSTVPADVYVDDKPENIDDVFAFTHAHAILFDQPWNQGHYLGVDIGSEPRLHRAKGWNQTTGIIELIRRSHA